MSFLHVHLIQLIWANTKIIPNARLEHQLGNCQKFPDKATFFVRVVLCGLMALGNPETKKKNRPPAVDKNKSCRASRNLVKIKSSVNVNNAYLLTVHILLYKLGKMGLTIKACQFCINLVKWININTL